MHYNHLATATNILWRLIEAYGHDPHALFCEAGIDPDLLNRPGARISGVSVNRIWAKASDIIDDPCFGLKADKYWHPSYIHALGYAWLASHTLREAFNRFVRYIRIISEKAFLELVEDSRGFTIKLGLDLLSMRIPAQIDLAMAMLIHMCRLNYGEDLKPIAVNIRHDEPACAKDYSIVFNAPVEFGANQDSITFSSVDVDKYLIGANPQLARLNDQVMIEYLAKLERENIINRVIAAIVEMLPSGGVTDDKIAEQLNMSERSLQRRLKEAGVTFRSLLTGIRKDLAFSYIRDPEIEFVEVAFLLGFSDQSAFSRAFKRWTGSTPTQFRMSG
jgi:AraC-like DNA-binding protein